MSYCDEDTQFQNETYHVESDEEITKDIVIEKLASYMQNYEDETNIAIVWASVIVIPLTDPKQTWRMEYVGGETSQAKVLQ